MPIEAVAAGSDHTQEMPAGCEQPVGRVEQGREGRPMVPHESDDPAPMGHRHQWKGDLVAGGHLPPRLGADQVSLAAARLVGQVFESGKNGLALVSRALVGHEQGQRQKCHGAILVDLDRDLQINQTGHAAHGESPPDRPRTPISIRQHLPHQDRWLHAACSADRHLRGHPAVDPPHLAIHHIADERLSV